MSTAATTMPSRTWRSNKPAKNEETVPKRNFEEESYRSSQFPPGYDTEKPGGNIFQGRAFNTFKRDDNRVQTADTVSVQDKEKTTEVKFSDKEPDPEFGGREVVTTNVGGLIVKTTKSYEVLLAERDALLETDHRYRKRIQELEEENIQMLTDYDSLYKENQTLRQKLDRGGDETHVESYQRLYSDRQILREAETAYKKRIAQLELQTKEMLTNFESLNAENRLLRDKSRKLEDKLNAVDRLDDVKRMNELEKKVKQLEKQIRLMGYEKEGIMKEKNEIENQMLKLQEDVSDLNKRNITLERENEAFRRGFIALGQNEDNRWKDDSSMRRKNKREEEEQQQMKDELREFRTKVEVLRNEKIETDKKNVSLTTKIAILEKDKTESERRLLEVLREQSKRTPSAVKRRQAEANELANKKLDDLTQMNETLTKENIEMKTKHVMIEKENNDLKAKLIEAASIKRETSSAVKRKQQTEQEKEDLRKMIEVMKDTTNKYETRVQSLQNTITNLETELKAEKKANKSKANEKAEQLDEKVKELQLQLIEVNTENKRITDEENRLKVEYRQLKDNMEGQLKRIERERDELEKEKLSLEEKATVADSANLEKISQLKDELNATQVELNILKPKYEQLENEADKLKLENAQMLQTIETTKSELHNAVQAMKNEKDLYNKLTRVEREHAALKTEKEEMEVKFNIERQKLEKDLEELLKNQEFMNTGLAEHRVRLDMIQNEKSDLKSEHLKLVKANERHTKTITDLNAEIEKIKDLGASTTKALNEEIKSLNQQLKESEADAIKAKQELETVTNEKENQVNKLIKQLNKLKSEREIETQQLKDQSDSLKSEVARLQVFEDRMKTMEDDLKAFIIKLQESEAKNKSLTDARLLSLGLVVNEMKSENLANRMRAAESEQNEIEKQKLELEIKQDAVNEIRKLREENVHLLGLLEDKRAAEEAQDERTKRKNKYNEVVAQNKRLEAENKRILTLYESSNAEKIRQDLHDKTEKLKVIEAGYNRFNAENVRLRQIMEEKETEMKVLIGQINRGKSIQEQNLKIIAENRRLQEIMNKKDNMIIQLKEYEASKDKYQDIAANNTRLYEENRRLRESLGNVETKTDQSKEKEQAKSSKVSQAKMAEENAILKREIEAKLREKNRELEIQTDLANNLKGRNRRLQEEVKRLREELNEKNNRLVQLHDLESTSGKFKDLEEKNGRLYEENQRLRVLLESSGQERKNNSAHKALKKDENKEMGSEQWAVYIDKDQSKFKSDSFSESANNSKDKILHKRADSANNLHVTSPTLSDLGQIGDKLKIKSLLPSINTNARGSNVNASLNSISTAKFRAKQRVKALT